MLRILLSLEEEESMEQFTVLQEESFLKNVKLLADVKPEMLKSQKDTI
jgi:hypothetical protein